MGSLNIGIQLTIFGMGLVFLLLAVMALLITLLLRLDRTVADIPQPSAPEYPAGLDAEALAGAGVQAGEKALDSAPGHKLHVGQLAQEDRIEIFASRCHLSCRLKRTSGTTRT